MSSVQRASSSAFCHFVMNHIVSNLSVCLPQFIRVRRGCLLSNAGMSGELLCCETYTMLKNPCSEKYLLIKGGRYRAYFRDIIDIEICILLLQRTSHQGCCEGSLGSLSLMENTSKPDMWKASCLISSKLLMLKEVFFFCLIKQHHDCCDNNSF